MKKKIIFIGMILSLLSSAATSMAVDIDTDTRNVIISGKAAAKQSTATIIIKNKTNGDIAYIAEANVIDGRYYTKFKLPIDNPSDYTVSINSGGEDITKDILSAVYHSSKFENVLSFSGQTQTNISRTVILSAYRQRLKICMPMKRNIKSILLAMMTAADLSEP